MPSVTATIRLREARLRSTARRSGERAAELGEDRKVRRGTGPGPARRLAAALTAGRRRPRHRCDPVRYLISGRASRFEGVGSVEAGPAANNPGPRAVLRRHAPSATRQRTLEANGIDCGASGLWSGLRHERHGSRSGDRLGELGDERQVGVRRAGAHASTWPCSETISREGSSEPATNSRRRLLLRGDCESGGRDGERGAAGQSAHA